MGLQQFADDYGVSPGPGQAKIIPSSWQSAGTGSPNAGMAFGCIAGGYCSAYLGRKNTIVVLSVISIIGVIIQCAVPVRPLNSVCLQQHWWPLLSLHCSPTGALSWVVSSMASLWAWRPMSFLLTVLSLLLLQSEVRSSTSISGGRLWATLSQPAVSMAPHST